MGSLQILDKLDQIEVLYEPIYSADGHCVVGYEVIGQVEVEGQFINLESFTYDQEVPAEIRSEIEQLLISQAIVPVKHELANINLSISRRTPLPQRTSVGRGVLRISLENERTFLYTIPNKKGKVV